MKYKTALAKCIYAAKFNAVLLVICVAAAVKWPAPQTIGIAVVVGFYLAMEIRGAVRIRRMAAADPSILDRRMT